MIGSVLSTLTLAGLAWASTNSSSSLNLHDPRLAVQTRAGTFVGDYNDTYPDVRQFKCIPYAKPPVGPLRWTSPERLDDSSEVVDSTIYGPSCAQYVSAIPAVWGLNITGNLIVNYGQSLFDGRAAQNSAEDCLSLAIWTPANASSSGGGADDVKELLPVVIYLTGGGDQTGGVNIPTQLPSQWVHRSQRHIVVTTNYRVNIFGNPHARGLDGNGNFGRQDQRAAVEWVAENIAAFGGDPARMTLWGQSAGAIAADEYLFAFPEDPLVRAAITSSGSALISSFGSRDHEGANFTFVARALGCDFGDANKEKKRELECMRRIPFQRISNFVGQYQDNSTLVNPSQPALTFSSQPDEKWVFANYTQRYLDGKVAKIPSVIGTTAREGSALAYVPLANYAEGPAEETVVSGTLRFVCPGHESSVARDGLGLATYRYHWAGDFANLGPVPWLGAYHYSDLYMVFGSYGIAPGEIPPLEVETSEVMQDYFLDFVTDPESLAGKGWPEYHAGAAEGGKLAQFGAHGKAVEFVTGDSVEGACHIPGVEYNTRP
ncbi:carboxylesterase [Apiospora aurea]|uniref:Carboxylic ester hydrolase n=1 Tax=Apiospora aurea TaxID=335848 RepID=A0ABR1PYI0_9PEZI